MKAYVAKRLEGIDAERMDPAKFGRSDGSLTADQGEGAFLLARVVTSQLRDEPIDTSIPGWESALSRSIEEAFEKDLVAPTIPPGRAPSSPHSPGGTGLASPTTYGR